MELHQLRYFVAIAECESFRQAAERCRVAQPSLSQQIAKLETNLGRKLFDRLGRSIALTEAGRALLPRARRILSEVCRAEREIAEDVERGRGRLAIGAIPTVAPYLLPETIRRFRESTPHAEITVVEDVTESLVETLIRAEIDLAIMALPVNSPQLAHEELITEPLLLVSAADHPLAATTQVSIEDLASTPSIVLHEVHCLSRQVDAFCRGHGLSQNIVCRTAQLSTVLQLVGLGLGVSLVPRLCAADDRSSTRVYRKLDSGLPTRTLVAAWHGDRERPRLAERFLEALHRECLRHKKQAESQPPPGR